jgi:hypothetical protein
VNGNFVPSIYALNECLTPISTEGNLSTFFDPPKAGGCNLPGKWLAAEHVISEVSSKC